MQAVSVFSPADRVCGTFVRFGLLIAVTGFILVGSDVLLAQWIIGNASAEFILGTMAIIAGVCIGIFAMVAAIGLAVAAVVSTKR
jgi:hypothetical protein